jgi:hypothetical protein
MWPQSKLPLNKDTHYMVSDPFPQRELFAARFMWQKQWISKPAITVPRYIKKLYWNAGMKAGASRCAVSMERDHVSAGTLADQSASISWYLAYVHELVRYPGRLQRREVVPSHLPAFPRSTAAKDKVFPVQTLQVYRGSRGRNPLFLNLGSRWRWLVSFRLRPLYVRENIPIQ